jgi:hypothetical protein
MSPEFRMMRLTTSSRDSAKGAILLLAFVLPHSHVHEIPCSLLDAVNGSVHRIWILSPLCARLIERNRFCFLNRPPYGNGSGGNKVKFIVASTVEISASADPVA